MNKEEIKIKEFDKQQLEILLNDLQDIDKFTGFKDGAFKYELGKYQANLLVGCIKKYKEVIDKATNELFILKDMIYKPETREENFEIQRKISSIIKRLNGKEVE